MTNDVAGRATINAPDNSVEYSFIDGNGNEVAPGQGIVATPSAERTLQKAQTKLFALQSIHRMLKAAQRKELAESYHAKMKAKRRKKNKMANESRRRNR